MGKKKEVASKKPSCQTILTDEHKQKLLKMSEISLWLDDYDDIFSDFDPRHYSQRALSDDFLGEAKRASRDKTSGTIELKFLVPSHKRNRRHEGLIKKRLREHFTKHFNMIDNERKSIIRQGFIFTWLGVILMFITTYIMVHNIEKGMLVSFLIILMEPAGWFLLWEGLNLIIFESKRIRPELEFYKKMSQCRIDFLPY